MEGNYVAGANIAGFEKVVDAMTAQGGGGGGCEGGAVGGGGGGGELVGEHTVRVRGASAGSGSNGPGCAGSSAIIAIHL